MYTGEKLAEAIRKGVDQKVIRGLVRSKVEIARYFRIAGPSLHNWMDTGRVSRSKTPLLLGYFMDVTDPEDWGLESWPDWVVKPGNDELNAAADNGAAPARLAHSASELLHGLQDLLRAQAPVDDEEARVLTLWRRLTPAQKEQISVLMNAMQK